MSDKTKKMCRNGHVMDPAWETCPYCPSEKQPNPNLARTVKVESPAGGGAGLARTVKIEDAGAGGGPKQPAPAPRKTEILRAEPEIDAVAWLVGVMGSCKGKLHKIQNARTTVGAGGDCDVRLDDPHVSDLHASIRFQEGTFTIADLDTTNGTIVNGSRVAKQDLSDGDRIELGASRWIFKCVVFDGE